MAKSLIVSNQASTSCPSCFGRKGQLGAAEVEWWGSPGKCNWEASNVLSLVTPSFPPQRHQSEFNFNCTTIASPECLWPLFLKRKGPKQPPSDTDDEETQKTSIPYCLWYFPWTSTASSQIQDHREFGCFQHCTIFVEVSNMTKLTSTHIVQWNSQQIPFDDRPLNADSANFSLCMISSGRRHLRRGALETFASFLVCSTKRPIKPFQTAVDFAGSILWRQPEYRVDFPSIHCEVPTRHDFDHGKSGNPRKPLGPLFMKIERSL